MAEKVVNYVLEVKKYFLSLNRGEKFKAVEIFVAAFGLATTLIFVAYQAFQTKRSVDELVQQNKSIITQTNLLDQERKIEIMPAIVPDPIQKQSIKNSGRGIALNIVTFNIINTSTIYLLNGKVSALGPDESMSGSGLADSYTKIAIDEFNNMSNGKIHFDNLVTRFPVVINRYQDLDQNCYASINMNGSLSIKDLGSCPDFILSCVAPK